MKILTSKFFIVVAIIMFFCTPLILSAQISPNIDWQRCIGGTNIDYPYNTVATRDGGNIVVGCTYSNNGDVQSSTTDIMKGWVVKLDQSGQIQWSRIIESVNYGSVLKSVIESSDGNFIVVGSSNSLNFSSILRSNALAMKLSKSGDIIWQKVYGGSSSDQFTSIVENKFEGGGFLLSGIASSKDGDVKGRHPSVSEDSADVWIVKITNNGDIEWQKCLGGSKGENEGAIIQMQDGGYLFAGNTSSDDGDVMGHTVGENGWLVKLGRTGNIIWQKCLNVSLPQSAPQSITSTIDGGITLISASKDTMVPGFHYGSDIFGNDDFYVAHFNSTGSLLWERCYGGSDNDEGNGITTTSDGGYLCIGTTSSVDGNVKGIHIGRLTPSDVWILKLRSDGSLEWSACYGGSANEYGISILQAKDGNILFVGKVSSLDGDVYGIHSNSDQNRDDIWAVKLGISASVSDASDFDFTGLVRDKFLKIYPNPSSSSVHLEMLPWFSAKGVEIYNLLGTKLSCETTVNENGANINVHALPNGTYIARISYTTEKANGTFTLPLIVYH